ncbi:hypothetical protein BD779DRAFT_1793224 [Infundibulicybe gibba]|nr:hypothetical protein BD779DRAFT_1793224 [Infundibulicybe gibba]
MDNRDIWARGHVPALDRQMDDASEGQADEQTMYTTEWVDDHTRLSSTAIETSYYWNDLIKLNQTVAFERAMVISRPAAHRSPLGSVWFKMIASTTNISAPAKFWEPVASSKPVVTYISRQGGGRRLRDADHQGLVAALEELEAEGVCEVFVARMETMSIKEQVAAAARSTVSFSVRRLRASVETSNMDASIPRSTTFEMFNPADYTFDYEILARNMGHRHYAVWNDTFATYPAGTYHEGVNFSDASHGRLLNLLKYRACPASQPGGPKAPAGYIIFLSRIIGFRPKCAPVLVVWAGQMAENFRRSQVTARSAEFKISAAPSQVTPRAELNEMVQ